MNSKVAFVVFAAMFACGFATDCSFVLKSKADGKSYKYDLSPMSHAQGVQDTLYYRMPKDGSYIYMNVCGPSSQKCASGSAVCMRSADATKYTSLGKFTEQEVDNANDLDPGQGCEVTYNDGDDCILGSWQAVITMKCDPTATGIGQITQVDAGECWYRIYVSSQYACGKLASSSEESEGSGAGAGETVAMIILIVLAVCVVLYFSLGVIYQVKVKEAASFREYVIHNEFWCSLPGMIKDGVLFIFHGCKKGDYVSV